MNISVVICTRNRCELLRGTLESLCSLRIPADVEWELLVVNNNSSDATNDVIASFQKRLPIRRIFESEAGVSKARNTGARAATGELVLFSDDDVEVDEEWMAAYLEAARRWPDAAYFGGVIRPLYAPGVARWVKRHEASLKGMLCLLDLGPGSRRFAPREFPYGPNMAVRRAALALALFNERVGRKSDEQMRGSETSYFLRLEQLKMCGAWVPEAKVWHVIPLQRATFKYFCNYYYGQGRGRMRLGIAGQLHSRRKLRATALKTVVKLCLHPRKWPQHLSHMARTSGEYSEARQIALDRKATQPPIEK